MSQKAAPRVHPLNQHADAAALAVGAATETNLKIASRQNKLPVALGFSRGYAE